VGSRYEIRIKGRLSQSLASEFERLHLAVVDQPVETVLGGSFEDQSALYGMLRQMEGLGLELMEVRRVAPCQPDLDDAGF
jgi:epsilon-lactone hydrolase